LYHDNNNKIETVSLEIINQKTDMGIYFERNVYSTIAIIPIKNNNDFVTYVRIIGIENTIEKLHELINKLSMIKIKAARRP
jgi:hypothetical protein